jgi:hypothetical protein
VNQTQLKQFISDRYEALMSMDKDKILAFARKYNLRFIPVEDETFWIAVHKARSGAGDLPFEERFKSHKFLVDLGFESWYDGDENEPSQPDAE